MIRRINVLLLGAAFTFTAFAREEYTRHFDKTIAVRVGSKIYLEHKLGDIVIRTHAQPDVEIHADIKVSASDVNQARMFADRVEILVEPSSSELAIRTRYPTTLSSAFGFRNVSYTARYEVTIPEIGSFGSPQRVWCSFGYWSEGEQRYYDLARGCGVA